MANLVLYRKYRPKSFNDVVGQRGNSLDLIEIDAASNRGIDEIRDLKENVRFAPATLKYKVYVIDEAHQLTKEASNALLKTLEEPPAHALFILATTEAHKMIPTILSRCQRFDFKKLRVAELVERMRRIAEAEEMAIAPDALSLIAAHSGGSFRDAESILDKVFSFRASSEQEITAQEVKELLGIGEIGLVADFADLILKKDAPGALAFISSNLQEGVDPQEFAKNIVQYLRQAMIIAINPDLTDALGMGFTKEEEARITAQARDFDIKELQNAIGQFAEAEQKMKYATIIQLPLELAALTACGV
ncbi:MAG: DNA polymerase III subunit gamma/tau [Candidatus Wildermuthbacteria bacterium]|nr:DNA polymerase III subunit gamma/tau [Candidatus Wildermuthbacteria bacterium]